MGSRDRSLSLIVGGFVLVSLGALAVGILMLTSESGLFVERYRIQARFSNVQGLLPGAPVWLAGKQVGRIERVAFTPLGSPEPILVTMQIDLEVQRRIRSNSVASIGTIGVLGDSYIELRVGTPDGRILEDGDDIPAISPTNLYEVLARGTGALDAFQALAENLNRVVDDVQEEGVVAKAASAVSATSDIILQLEGGDGLLHSLVYDEYSGGGVESITRSLSSLEHILEAVRTGDGLLNLNRVAAQVGFVIDRLPTPPPVFDLIAKQGGVATAEMFTVFNMGIGLCIVVAPENVDRVTDIVSDAHVIGRAVEGAKRVELPQHGIAGSTASFAAV